MKVVTLSILLLCSLMNVSAEVICNENDILIPNPEDCGSFYSCVNGVPTPFVCPPTLQFNANSQSCVNPDQSTCGAVFRDSDNSFKCPGDGFFGNPKNCRKYYFCVLNRAFPLDCPNNFEFDDSIQFCNFPQLANCHVSTTSKPTTTTTQKTTTTTQAATTTTTTTQEPTTASTTTTTQKPTTTDAPTTTQEPSTSSTTTTTQKSTTTDAPTPTQEPTTSSTTTTTQKPTTTDEPTTTQEPTTSSTTTTTQKPTTTDAPTTTQEPTTSSTTTTTQKPTTTDKPTTTLKPTEKPTDCSNDEDGKPFANPDDCSSFLQCANGQPVKIDCPAGLEFNADLKVCDFPSSANCSKSKKSLFSFLQFWN